MTHTKPRFGAGLLLLLSLLSTAAGLPASRAQSNRQLDAPISVPFELVTRHIMIPVSVNGGAPLWFVLDTGDKVGIIDLDHATRMKLTLDREVQVGGVGAQRLTG